MRTALSPLAKHSKSRHHHRSMKPPHRPCSPRHLAWIALLLLSSVPSVVFPAAADFRAGAAVRVVTPDPLLPVSGGVGPSNPANKKAGELTVRALVIEEGNTRVAIVGADFLGFPSVLGNRVRAQVTG